MRCLFETVTGARLRLRPRRKNGKARTPLTLMRCTRQGCTLPPRYSAHDPRRTYRECAGYRSQLHRLARPVSRRLKRLWPRPGNVLAAAIKLAAGVDPTLDRSCNCRPKVADMNRAGWRKCWRDRATIIGELCDKADKLERPCPTRDLRGLTRAAAREANRRTWRYLSPYESTE